MPEQVGLDGLKPIDAASAKELHAALDRVDGLVRRHAAVVRATPASGSSGHADKLLPHARWLGLHSLRSIAVALDHLQAWQLMVRGKTLPMYSPMTLLRGALEGSARCRWLIDASAQPLERVARGIAMQVDDYRERHAWELALPHLPEQSETWQSAAGRLYALKAARDAAAIPTVPFPGPTYTAKHHGLGEGADRSWPYRLTSAFAHGKEWALLAMTIGEGIVTEDGVRLGPVSSNDAFVAGMTRITVDQMELAIGELEDYLGMKVVA
jgi:hypothetical protein